MLRTETDVKYIGDEAVIVPLDVPVSATYEYLLSMIYSRTALTKTISSSPQLSVSFKKENRFQPCPIWDDNSLSQMLKLCRQPRVRGQLLGNFTQLLLGQNDNVEEFEYGCGPSSAPIAMTYDFPYSDHSAPSLRFENVENIGNAVSSDRTPWGTLILETRDLQHAKLYSISAHQEYVVVESTTKLLVLRCKKAKQSQCPWKLRAMVVKGTTSFAINKYNGSHKCVNPCLNRDHQQLDSNLIAHIQGMIKTQFTLSLAAIQAKLPHFFIALEQANLGCVVISKTFPGIMENTEIFQRVFWTFHPSIEGFKHCRPVLSIDGTHLYGKYKGTLMIAMGCDGNNQLFPLAFALTEDRHPGIMAAMSDVHLGWSEPYSLSNGGDKN
ncbi:hypothetical protein AAG906_029185 [Vitis piasezkii]